MKSFFKFILEIFIISLVLGLIIQYVSDNGLKNLKHSRFNDWENIIKGSINSDIIINGSSRGYVGYNAETIGGILNGSCFNLSFNAGGYYLQQSKFDIYSKKNKKPKVIIQNIDLVHFNKNIELPDEAQFIPFINDDVISSFITKYDIKFNYLKYIPLLKYNQNLQLLKTGLMAHFSSSVHKNEKTFNGYCPQERKFKIDYHNLEKLDKNYGKIINKQNIRQLLKEMVDFYCVRLNKNAQVFFIWAPENKLRLDKNFDLERKIIIDELHLIQNKNKNFHFIDMAYDDISNHDEFYYDTFHLNELGANEFSKKVSMEINKFLN